MSMASNDNAIQPEKLTSPTHVTTIRGQQLHTDTATGTSWVRKYLHPPCSMDPGYCGIPDENNSPSAHAEYRAVQNVQSAIQGTVPTAYTDSMRILLAPFACAPAIAWKRNATTQVWGQSATDVVLNPNINIADLTLKNASGRLAYGSATIDLNATDFANQGVVTVGALRANSTTLASTAPLLKHLNDHSSGDREAYCKWLRMLSKSFSNKQPVFADNETNIKHLEQVLTDANATAIVLHLGRLPETSTDVMMLSPNSTSTVATEGAYVAKAFSQPVIPYKPMISNFDTTTDVPPQAPIVVIQVQVDDTHWNFQTINVETRQPGNAGPSLREANVYDFMFYWVFFEALTQPVAGASAPYITIKTITGYEFQPLTDSPTAPFVKNSAVFDRSALDLATTINHGRLDSLPARDNFLGTIGRVLLKAAPTIVSTAMGIFGKKQTNQEKDVTKETVDYLLKQLNRVNLRPEKKEKKIEKKVERAVEKKIGLPQRARKPKAAENINGPITPRQLQQAIANMRAKKTMRLKNNKAR